MVSLEKTMDRPAASKRKAKAGSIGWWFTSAAVTRTLSSSYTTPGRSSSVGFSRDRGSGRPSSAMRMPMSRSFSSQKRSVMRRRGGGP